jgi:UDP-N-acetylglucosamine diphosphorylase / glucose-1-phosphate thymidylyltransferase / UDP-N-acetylgalactosamine diphosphorylase / glucosamine-1-phosphate N-acetyltransferase / galactosamine-1-phosphate N-acetyltransferase
LIENVVIFEDDKFENFYPLSLNKPVYELRCGIYSLLEKIVYRYPKSHVSLITRESLKPLQLKKYPQIPINIINTSSGVLFVNGRFLYNEKNLKFFPDGKDRDFILVNNGDVVVAYLRANNVTKLKEIFNGPLNSEKIIKMFNRVVSFREVNVDMVQYPWDLIKHNKEQLEVDFIFAKCAGIIKGLIHESVIIYDEGNVFIDKDSEIMANCVLDARFGPIYIGENVMLKAGAYIEGPAYIGSKSIVSSAHLRSGSNIGVECKVGGEISDSIIHGYSNKGHEGFVGSSYIGEWVNLGALTTTSNLKNNYSSVKISYGKEKFDTGMNFLGSIIGDYVKTGIGTLLDTGTVIGIGTNIFGGGVFSKYIKSFKWGNNKKLEKYDFEKFIETLKIVMYRRGQDLSVQEENLIEYLYSN